MFEYQRCLLGFLLYFLILCIFTCLCYYWRIKHSLSDREIMFFLFFISTHNIGAYLFEVY